MGQGGEGLGRDGQLTVDPTQTEAGENMDRRSLMSTIATMAVGAVAGCALLGTANHHKTVKTRFDRLPNLSVKVV